MAQIGPASPAKFLPVRGSRRGRIPKARRRHDRRRSSRLLRPIPARMWSSRKAASTPVATSRSDGPSSVCHKSTSCSGVADSSSSRCFSMEARCASSPAKIFPNSSTLLAHPFEKVETIRVVGRDRSERSDGDHPIRQERSRAARHADRRRDPPDGEPLKTERIGDGSDVGHAVGDLPALLPGRAAVPWTVVRRDECPVPPHRAGAVGRACSSLACPRSREPESPPGRRPHER